MFKSHKSPRLLTPFAVACACLLFAGTRAAGLRAQTPSDHLTRQVALGVELYERGDLAASAEALRQAAKSDKKDPAPWYYLGLTHLRQGDADEARESFDRSIRLGFDSLRPGIPARTGEEYQALGPEGRRARRAQLAADYERLADAAANYVRLVPEAADSWRETLDALRAYARGLAVEDGPDAIFLTPDVSEKAKVMSRPEPLYTEEARNNHVRGTVSLRMVLAADGSVRHLIVLRGLPGGMTEKAIEAARGIKFVPATKDGRPVSLYSTVEYNFNVY